MSLVCYLLILIFSLVGLAFVTLYERSILGSLGKRLGPNYVSIFGLLQPLGDFLSLFLKWGGLLSFVELFFWFVFPLWGLMLYLMVLVFLNLNGSFIYMEMGFLYMFGVFMLLTYMFMFSGWSGNSKYGVIASLRVVVQMMSYEVGFVFMFLVFLIGINSLNYLIVLDFNINWFIMFSIFFFFIWILVSIVEMSRSPFDFIEGESELISGFNLEYGGLYFTLIFLVEYGFLIVTSLILSSFLLGGVGGFFLFLFLFIFIRGVFPRMRYDSMMYLFWKDLIMIIFMFFMYLGILF